MPVGTRLCIARREEFRSICKTMPKNAIGVDFVTGDGGEGNTGVAPRCAAAACWRPNPGGLDGLQSGHIDHRIDRATLKPCTDLCPLIDRSCPGGAKAGNTQTRNHGLPGSRVACR